MRIFILGLRRSGTTIFWKMFRQDPRLLAVNEPFNPALSEMPVEIPNRSRRELIEIFREDPRDFWRRFAAIGTTEELHDDLTDRQRDWLQFLLDRQPGFVMDALALTISAVCQSLSRLEVTRVVDVSTRRIQLQRKVGVGITPEVF